MMTGEVSLLPRCRVGLAPTVAILGLATEGVRSAAVGLPRRLGVRVESVPVEIYGRLGAIFAVDQPHRATTPARRSAGNRPA
jgi:hypothetical protein